MNTKDDGGPAFPNVPDGAGDKWADWDKGMTLRDYFACQAMPVIYGQTSKGFAHISKLAYELADAMLAARGAM